MPVAFLSGRRTRTLSGPLRPATSMSRASSRKTGAGKMPLPSLLARRDTSGGTEITGTWVAIRASSWALNARASSMSFCSTSGAAGRTVAIGASLFRLRPRTDRACRATCGFDPAPMSDDLVRIRVRAAAVNFFDLLQLGGTYQVKPELPFIPGAEVAGDVEAAPPGTG